MNIKNLFRKTYNGLQADTRSQAEKNKDYAAEEVFSEQPPVYRKVFENEWLKYQIRNQAQSGSCVANTVAKMFEVSYTLRTGQSKKFSHAPIYIKRNNKPSAGMVGTNALDIAIKTGTCLEIDVPSENMTDTQLDAITIPLNFNDLNNLVVPSNYFVLKSLNFDYLASLVNRLGSAMYWVDTNYTDWNLDIPRAGKQGGGVRHSITIVDTINFEGSDYLVIEDSWGLFGKYKGQRLISREQFESNGIFAAVFTELKYDTVDKVEKTNFSVIMQQGNRFDDIKRLQDFLKTEGVFPSNLESTGFYGNLTAKAVYAFQIKHNVAPMNELDQLKGKRVGQKTLNKINKILNK